MAEVWQVLIVIALFLMSALFSGLNLGLMSLDPIGMDIVNSAGNVKEKKYANILLPLRKKGNFLLCTLLFGNTIVNAFLAIWVEILIPDFMTALIVTSIGIVIFGEIIPQSICSRHGLMVGYYTRYFVYFFMVVTAIISWPLGKILDCMMGEEVGSVYKKKELVKLMELHKKGDQGQRGGQLDDDEIKMIQGALKMEEVTVEEIMTPMESVFSLDITDQLDHGTLVEITRQGHSRIPVLDNDRISHILLVKNLILVDPDESVPVRALSQIGRKPFWVPHTATLHFMLNKFQTGDSHVAVIQKPNEVKAGQRQCFNDIGIVTLEAVIEKLIQEEIDDEFDDQNYAEKAVRVLVPEHRFSGNKLTESGIQLCVGFLSGAFPDKFGPELIRDGDLKYLFENCEIITLTPKFMTSRMSVAQGSSEENKNNTVKETSISPIEYDKTMNAAYLILDGVCEILIPEHDSNMAMEEDHIDKPNKPKSIENFELGVWTLLGADVLTRSNVKLIADFTISIVEEIKLLEIKRTDYHKALRPFTRKKNKLKHTHYDARGFRSMGEDLSPNFHGYQNRKKRKRLSHSEEKVFDNRRISEENLLGDK